VEHEKLDTTRSILTLNQHWFSISN